jgi:aspartate aminotransferase
MPNPGFPSTRTAIAAHLSAQQGVPVAAEDIVLTVGAAGALNVALHSLLDPGDEVLILAPYFVEYIFYAQNHQAVPVVVETAADFSLDLPHIEQALSAKSKVLLLNTPNNPTGQIYSADSLARLGQLLQKHEQRTGRSVYLLYDTPYAGLTFRGARNPPLFAQYPHALLAHSYSKELGLAGERIGFLAIHPHAPHRAALRDAVAFNNRVLGFVNAPALLQRAIEGCLDASVDVSYYERLGERLSGALRRIGYDLVPPQGGFYLFPKTPIADDVAFTHDLLAEKVLVVPGQGFGRGGHIRISFSVEEEVVDRAIPRFARAFEKAMTKGERTR